MKILIHVSLLLAMIAVAYTTGDDSKFGELLRSLIVTSEGNNPNSDNQAPADIFTHASPARGKTSVPGVLDGTEAGANSDAAEPAGALFSEANAPSSPLLDTLRKADAVEDLTKPGNDDEKPIRNGLPTQPAPAILHDARGG